MRTLTLFNTSACHLCELAEAVILPELALTQETLVLKDISECDQLMQHYALTIPVFHRDDTDTELNWPFTRSDIQEFLRSQ
ncbi:MAG: glutaredoxin family protein [Pseudomonadales bacterium]